MANILKHPLLFRVGKTDKSFRTPYGARKSTDILLETGANERTITEHRQGMKMIMNRRAVIAFALFDFLLED